MAGALLGFKKVWAVDFEFSSAPGSNSVPVCLVAHELVSGRRLRIWEDELLQMREPPYDIGPDSLFVAFYASAELGCHIALGWEMPVNVLDLFVEFRNRTNGLETPSGSSLLGAMVYFGIPGIESTEKEEMRTLALRGGPWTEAERTGLLTYCETDVVAVARLLKAMQSNLDLPRAVLRGRYMAAAARMEYIGTPIDVELLNRLRRHWTDIQDDVIRNLDADYGVYDGRTFKTERWEQWLIAQQIPWPRLPSGRLALDDDAFSDMAKSYPLVAPIKELRATLSKMKLFDDLAVGADGRNRCLLSAFRASSGRNAPSTAKFIFSMPSWLRGLIKPAPGYGLAYCDFSQQEFAIAAYLSGDEAMQDAYTSGDPYLTFAIQAGAAPKDATRASHGAVREQFKSTALGVLYGMGPEALALRIAQPLSAARELLVLHKRTYRKFWKWSTAVLDHAMLTGELYTVFGWTVRVGNRVHNPRSPRSLQNFPMQANGAEMLRLACCQATEQGIRVCAPIHDALLIEAPVGAELEQAVAETQRAMAEASAIVLGGPALRSDVKLVRYPERYTDPRGARMWATVSDSLRRIIP